jgi:CheY-like chemotaxis protein
LIKRTNDPVKPATATPSGAPRVLVIDDDPAFIKLMIRALGKEFTVFTALDGLDGYALLCEHQPEVVLLDAMMPVIDGWTLLKKIRSNPATAKVCVIVVTGVAPEVAYHESERFNVHDILLKPIVPSQVLSAVRKAVAGDPPSMDRPQNSHR